MENDRGGNADNGNRSLEGDVMTTGMMIHFLICGLIGLALVVLALMSLIENWFKQLTKAVVFIAFLAIIGVVK